MLLVEASILLCLGIQPGAQCERVVAPDFVLDKSPAAAPWYHQCAVHALPALKEWMTHNPEPQWMVVDVDCELSGKRRVL